MSEVNFIGIDISKEKFNVAIELNKRWVESSFENTAKGHRGFVSWIRAHTESGYVCLESTGPYGEDVAEYLHGEGIKVSVVNPMQIKHYAKSLLSRNKNDYVDARVIASYAEQKRPMLYQPKTEEQKLIRESVQLIDTLGAQKRQLSNQLESVRSKLIRAEINRSIKQIDKKIEKLEALIKETIKAHKELRETKSRLLTITGVGEKTVNQVLAYIPDISGFKSAKQLAAYIGVCPKQYQSGKYTGKTRLSKFGNPRLRKALYMPALVAKNNNPHLQAFCERLEKNGLKPKQIICAVMRKLVHIIFGMLKTQQDFNPALV